MRSIKNRSTAILPGFTLGRSGRRRAYDQCLLDRQIHQCGQQRQRDIGVPHPVIVAALEAGNAAQPCAEEAAYLMRQQGQPEQCGQVAQAEQLAYQAGSARTMSMPSVCSSSVCATRQACFAALMLLRPVSVMVTMRCRASWPGSSVTQPASIKGFRLRVNVVRSARICSASSATGSAW